MLRVILRPFRRLLFLALLMSLIVPVFFIDIFFCNNMEVLDPFMMFLMDIGDMPY